MFFRPTCRLLAVAALLMSIAPLAFAAEDAPTPEPGVGRYTMVPADGGFVRLDTQTGIVSHCRREGAGGAAVWRCAAIPEETLAKPDALTSLSDEVGALSREVAALRMRVDQLEGATGDSGSAQPMPDDAPGFAENPDGSPPGAAPRLDDETERALNLSEELMRRFFGMVREIKRSEEEERT